MSHSASLNKFDVFICEGEGPVTQHFSSESRTKRTENLVDVVVSGNFWSILAWPCFVRGMTVGGCSIVEALPNQGLPSQTMCMVKNR
jgi:hypothetical protein